MPEPRLTLMAVHAHPDDEATGTGGVLAKAGADGHRSVLVTCTDGACGDGPGGVKPGQPGHDPAQVVALREQELVTSCAVLGVTDLELLNYGDSGMDGWAQNGAAGSFWATPVEDAAIRLAALMDHYRPDVVVTYDPNGFYGHPDHIQAHRITMRAVELAESRPAKVYWTTVPRTRIAEFGQLMAEFAEADDQPAPEPPPGENAPNFEEMGLPDDEISTWVDCRAYGAQKFDALAAHASQGENIVFLRMGRDRFTETMGWETFVRVQDSTHAALPEADLFDGLGN